MTVPERVPVLLAMTGRPYEEGLLAAFERPGGRFRVARRCLDLTDLLAAGSTTAATVAVVWSGLHRLDRESVARLAAHGVGVVAVVEAADETTGTRETRRLLDLGSLATVLAPGVAEPTGPARFVADVCAQVVAAHVRRAPAGEDDRAVSSSPPTPDPAGSVGHLLPANPGRLVAVWGPTGAPGRTTVAVGLADELARTGVPVLLADADTYGPSVAQRLGVLDEVSGIAAAARCANAGELDHARLDAATRSLRPGLRVLTGLTRADRWPELPAAALSHLWRVAGSVRGATVVDTGFCLEEDDELSFDAVPLRRNAATLTCLAAADAVVVVGAADPVGLTRLLRGLHELDELGERRPGVAPAVRYVVVNRVRPEAVGSRRPERRINELLDLDAGTGARADRERQVRVLIPEDCASFDRALAGGRTLAETAAKSPARAPLVALARELVRRLRLA